MIEQYFFKQNQLTLRSMVQHHNIVYTRAANVSAATHRLKQFTSLPYFAVMGTGIAHTCML